MATINSFEEMDLWQKARQLSKQIFELTQKENFSKDFSLKDQIRRSSGSIMDNIAEGFERAGRKEFIQFLAIAKGSAGEVRSQLYRAYDQKYIDELTFKEIYLNSINMSKMLGGFISYLKTSEFKGIKYKESENIIKKLADIESIYFIENQ